jgi:hypothetical protein
MPIENACFIRCEGGKLSKETIPCLGHLEWNKIKQVSDVCSCPPPKVDWSCHMPRRDVCIYPAQSSDECRQQARGFAFTWECRSTTDNSTDFDRPKEYPVKMWYCNTNFTPTNPKKEQDEGIWFPTVGQQLSTWSGVSCLENQEHNLPYPPIPNGYVMVGEYSLLRLWAYNNASQWIYFIIVVLLICLGFIMVAVSQKIRWLQFLKRSDV